MSVTAAEGSSSFLQRTANEHFEQP